MQTAGNNAQADRVAVLSGAAGGLGRALCKALIANGVRVAALDRDKAALAELKSGSPKDMLSCWTCDITDQGAVESACREIVAQFGRIDIVINNAGITQLARFSETTPDAIRRVMDINFFGAVYLTNATLHPVRETRGLHVAVSSVAGFAPLVRRTAYAASKHAMTGFFSSLRAEEAEHGVDVLVVCPSFIATNPGAGTIDSGETGGFARPGSAGDGIDSMSPDEAAQKIVAAILGRRRFLALGRVAWASYFIHRISPSLYERLMRRNIREPK